MIDSRTFTTGGPVQAGCGVYITRPVDDEFLRLCRAGVYSYVLTTRQMGKSSLMEHTAEVLEQEGIRSVRIDLTELGVNLTSEQWYLGLIVKITDELKLAVECQIWWRERAHLGLTQRFSQFLRQVVLEQIANPIVISIDEIDTTLKLPFTDDFFAGLRAMYNARANDEAYRRLTFVLLGVARPSDLIKDRTRTPYNIGVKVDLQDFTFEELGPFQTALEYAYPGQGAAALRWVLDWTGGQPYLTQVVCKELVDKSNGQLGAADITQTISQLFFSEEAKRAPHLKTIRNRVHASPYLRGMLKIYRRVLQGQLVPDDERSIEQSELKLAGLVHGDSNGALAVRNKIYAHVFDRAWVKAETPVDWARRVAIGATAVAILAVLAAVIVVLRNQLPAIEMFEVNPSEVDRNGKVVVSWSVRGADKVELLQPSLETLKNQGSQTFPIDKNIVFTLRATNATGTVDRSIEVKVRGSAPTIQSFAPNLSTVIAGQGDDLVLSWVVAGADQVTIEGVPQQILTSTVAMGSVEIDPPFVTTTYALVASNPFSETRRSVTVNVSSAGCLTDQATQVRSGPSERYPIVDRPDTGTIVTPTGRTESGDWLQISAIQPGWLPSQAVQCSVSNLLFPSISATAIPPVPTPAPGSRIAFVSNRDGSPGIYAMNLDGSDVVLLTTLFARSPSWSPDGKRIAFVSSGEIYVINADGSNQQRLSLEFKNEVVAVAWSPDGTRFAFLSPNNDFKCVQSQSSATFYTAATNGMGVAPVAKNVCVTSWRVSWSPDGTRIVYAALSTDGIESLDTVDVNTLSQTRIITPIRGKGGPETTYANQDPAWSPDGTQIAFVSLNKGGIWLVHADGSQLQQLTSTADSYPTWSPDGKQLAFVSMRDVDSEIYVMNVDGSGQVNITNSSNSGDYSPAWQPIPTTVSSQPQLLSPMPPTAVPTGTLQ
jgi:Tol biopolymer transport system component